MPIKSFKNRVCFEIISKNIQKIEARFSELFHFSR